jgi:hypothetical protein
MGLPTINITFAKKASTLITRSSRGIVALILKDTTVSGPTTKFYEPNQAISSTDWSEKNIDYIKKAFLGGPSLVICERVGSGDNLALVDALERLRFKAFNYLAMPEAESADNTAISGWIDERRQENKTYKAVLANTDADDKAIINFTTSDIKVGSKTYSTAEYTARIAGILAGLPLNRSATYYVLSEVESITESETPSEDIENGELILINDGQKIKIARAVNSLQTVAATESEDLKKIKIVEAVDLIKEDIKSTFEDNYVGKVANSYDNKVLFCAAVNRYFKDLQSEGVLDELHDNKVEVDIEAQREFLHGKGIDVSEMTDEEIKVANTGSNVFITGSIQIQDAMEDLDLKIYM